MKKYIPLAFSIFCMFFCAFSSVYAKSYTYTNISEDIQINQDTTFDVQETQTYKFEGEFHKGWRSIPFNKIDDIRNIKVFDERTRTFLVYSPKQLDPLDLDSEGKYTFHKNAGSMEIEWYFNANDEIRSWIISYTVVGGLSFYKDHDELYWNILTDYDTNIGSSQVKITLPKEVSEEDLQITEYLSGGVASSSKVVSGNSIKAQASQLQPQAKFTVAFGWPKGVVDQKQYWKFFLETYWGYIASGVIWIFAVIFCFVYWFFGERWKKGRGTIIAEYEPPEGLPPAMGEVIVKEKTTRDTWPATIVDLAVRGFLKIQEEKPIYPKLKKIVQIVITILIVGFFWFLLKDGFSFYSNYGFLINMLHILLPYGIILVLIIIRLIFSIRGVTESRDYQLILNEETYNIGSNTLKPYEKDLINILFFSSGELRHFSTRDIRENSTLSQKVSLLFTKLQKTLLKNVSDLGMYERKKTIRHEYWGKAVLLVAFSVLFFLFFMFFVLGHIVFLILSVLGVGMLIGYFVFFEARLSQQGNIFKEKWLGFKQYLYTAERYRMQDLTPEIFERFLPYAMIFGVEKAWAKAFQNIATTPPNWYASSSTTGSSFSSTSSFSAGAFSASLSSSLSSSLAQSGGGGASGGGGSAGGGGGGGGGGAS